MSKKSKNLQIVETNRKTLLKLNDELRLQLDFILKIVKDDREKLQKNYTEYGDLFPRETDSYGKVIVKKTAMIPLVVEFKQTIASLLASIKTIQTQLLEEYGAGEEEAELREALGGFKTSKKLAKELSQFNQEAPFEFPLDIGNPSNTTDPDHLFR